MFSNMRRGRFTAAGALVAAVLSVSGVAVAQEPVTATVEIAEVAISVANANVDFGIVSVGDVASTKNGAVAPEVKNDGNVDLESLVIGYDHDASGATAVCDTGSWTAVGTATAGTDQFFMAAYNHEDSGTVIPTGVDTGINVLGGTTPTTLAPAATFAIDLDFAVPTEITTSGSCTTDLEVFGIAGS